MSFPRDAYPYTNFHELNLGYFITHFREIFSQWADLYDQMLSWKDATDEELATWKAGVEADLDQREAALRAELETWKAQTGQDIAGWEDATLAALTAWQTATQAVFEAIRVEAAGSASAAAASAGDAAIAKTAAETAQAAAEAAAASVQASASQITTNTEDIADLKTQLNNLVDGVAVDLGNAILGKYYSGTIGTTPTLQNNMSRAALPYYAPGKGSLTVSMNSGYMASVITLNDNNIEIADSGAFNGTRTIATEVNYKYAITLARQSTGTELTQQDVNTNFSVTFDSKVNEEINDLKRRVNDTEEDIDDINNIVIVTRNITADFVDGIFWRTGNGVGSEVSQTPGTHEEYSGLKVKCYAGDTITITCTGGGGGRAWAITDNNNIILSVAESNAVVNNLTLTATQDGYFYINNSNPDQPNKSAIYNSSLDHFVFRNSNSIAELQGNIDNIEADVDTIEEQLAYKPLKDKKWNVLGDSITANATYAPNGRYFERISARQNGMTTRNYGIGGTKIAGADASAFCHRYADMDNDADIITVYGGVNDYGQKTNGEWTNSPLGQYGDTTDTTFYGALKILIEGLIAKYPYALIVFITPIQPNFASWGYVLEENEYNATIYDYADAVIKMCGKYGIPVVDLGRTCGFTSRIDAEKTYYFYDGLHLNDRGHNKISYLIEDAMIKNAEGKIINTVS